MLDASVPGRVPLVLHGRSRREARLYRISQFVTRPLSRTLSRHPPVSLSGLVEVQQPNVSLGPSKRVIDGAIIFRETN